MKAVNNIIALTMAVTFATGALAKDLVLYVSLDDKVRLADVDATTAATPLELNTKTVAFELKDAAGADIAELILPDVYPVISSDCRDYVKKQFENNTESHFKNENISLDGYDRIFLGFPLWLHKTPVEIESFYKVRANDLNKKEIVFFSTSVHGNFEKFSENYIKEHQGLNLKSGFGIKTAEDKDNYKKIVADFVNSLKNSDN
ncbi:MAG: flavodoxin [Succinivibrio sp.]